MKLQQQQLPRHAPHLLFPSHPLTTGHVFCEKHCTFALDGKLVTELHGQRATAGGEIQQREGSVSHLTLQVWGEGDGSVADIKTGRIKPTGCGGSETPIKTAALCCQHKSWHLLSASTRQDCTQCAIAQEQRVSLLVAPCIHSSPSLPAVGNFCQ